MHRILLDYGDHPADEHYPNEQLWIEAVASLCDAHICTQLIQFFKVYTNRLYFMLFLDKLLMVVLCVAVILSGYMTVVHLIFGYSYTSYDAWIFGMNIALLLQMYDSAYGVTVK